MRRAITILTLVACGYTHPEDKGPPPMEDSSSGGDLGSTSSSDTDPTTGDDNSSTTLEVTSGVSDSGSTSTGEDSTGALNPTSGGAVMLCGNDPPPWPCLLGCPGGSACDGGTCFDLQSGNQVCGPEPCEQPCVTQNDCGGMACLLGHCVSPSNMLSCPCNPVPCGEASPCPGDAVCEEIDGTDVCVLNGETVCALELVEHVHRLTPAQARAVLRTIPDEHRLTHDADLARLSGRRATDHDRLAAALLVNARAVGKRDVAVLLELQADLVGLHLPA